MTTIDDLMLIANETCADTVRMYPKLRAALEAFATEQRAAGAMAERGQLHRFLNAAAGEGLVLDGVDAADLYVALFPERYAATLASIAA